MSQGNPMLEKVSSFEIVSFDIFNTLLMRRVIEPEEVFELAGQVLEGKGILPSFINPTQYRKYRIIAADVAQKKRRERGGKEATLMEICKEIPDYILCEKEAALEAEMEAEKLLTYLNPDTYSVIKCLHQQGKRIFLTSDMYLNREQISELLICSGFDMSYIDELIVSCEWGCNKVDGDLYDILLDHAGVNCKQIIHVGDSLIGDVVGAKKKGIESFYYNIFDRIPQEMIIERVIGEESASIYSMRLLMNNRIDHNASFWYREGAIVWGPIMAAFGEFVLGVADHYGIDCIYSLMREGVLFDQVFSRVSEQQGRQKDCKKMYVSRQAVIPGGKETVDKGLLDYCKLSSYATADEIWEYLGLDEFPEREYGNRPLEEYIADHSDDELESLLRSDGNIDKIKNRMTQMRSSFLKYFNQEFDSSKSFLTCDVGYNGTLPQAIDKTLRLGGEDIFSVHCFLFATDNAIDKCRDSIRIFGFLQSSEKMLFPKYFPFFENLMMGEEGTTVGYENINGTVTPVLKQRNIMADSIREQEDFQAGILDFIDLYCDCKRNKKDILISDKEAAAILRRLFLCPTKVEAGYYLEQKYEKDIGKEGFCEIDVDKELMRLKEYGFRQYKKDALFRGEIWPEAVISLGSGAITNLMELRNQDSANARYDNCVLETCHLLWEQGLKEVVIYGAGEIGIIYTRYLPVFEIRVACFIDKNKDLSDRELSSGVLVYAPEDERIPKDIPIVIASLAHESEIKETIKQYIGNTKIYTTSMNN